MGCVARAGRTPWRAVILHWALQGAGERKPSAAGARLFYLWILNPIFERDLKFHDFSIGDAAALLDDLKPIHVMDRLRGLGHAAFTASAKLMVDVPTISVIL